MKRNKPTLDEIRKSIRIPEGKARNDVLLEELDEVKAIVDEYLERPTMPRQNYDVAKSLLYIIDNAKKQLLSEEIDDERFLVMKGGLDYILESAKGLSQPDEP